MTANGVPNVNNAISQLPVAATPPGGYSTITTFDSTTWKFTFATDPSVVGGLDVNAQPVSGNPSTNGQSTPATISATLWGIADNMLWFLRSLFGISAAQGATVSGPPMTVSSVQDTVKANNNSSLPTNFITAMTMQESTMNPTTILKPGDPATPEGLMQVTPVALKQMQIMYPAQFAGISPSQLLDPAVNVAVGTAYLHYWLNKENGNLSAALADYGTGSTYAGPLQAGAAYLDQAGASATATGLYNSIHNALIAH